MSVIRTCLLLLSILAVGSGLSAGQEDSKAKAVPAKEDKPKEGAAKKHRGRFTISKETTYVTGPLDKDGYIDYAAALNERLGKGVTRENNANVLIWKALGPHPEGATMPAELFKLMGMEPPPEKGEYFVDLTEFMKDRFKIAANGKEMEEIYEQLNRCTNKPWTEQQYTKLDEWLKAN